MTILREQVLGAQGTIFNGPQEFFVHRCASYMFIRIEPMRSLETNTSKKGYSSGDKKLWQIFSHTIEYHKPQGTIHWDPGGILKTIDENTKSFRQNLRSRWEHKFLKERLIFRGRISNWPFFPTRRI